ncbi:alpha-N-acetylgalactosaminide alpha-2,6-sialyltransferase 1 isoform X2 [Salmo salar]|uniref:alpha-N-acetylgalactosaminide alpha-2,6-sialyltransferase n=1 Tax=Salmo salar TaxID=8030 RepID=A0ABM3CVW8_SALSA|nr:alpha-N-acetylgalactosaminide alpha-2,6-sialyltransferase 1 isoform X2 [Salmo salar]
MRAQFRGVLTLALMVAVCALLYVLLYGQISDHSVSYFQKLQLVPRGGRLHEMNCPCKNTTRDVFTAGSGSAHKETPMLWLQKKDFKQYPIWASEDVYVRDKQKRQMTCPQSLRNSQNTGFKQAFIPDIQMYLHGELLNQSEWNRLAYFNNPFGFMDYTNYTEIKAVVDLIPKPREPLLLPRGNPGCICCAVVATGGILNGSRMGKEIDAHDYVFRMNGAITKGYEEDVGNRTSVYVHTAHSITQSLFIFKKYGYDSAPHDKGIKYVLIPEGLRDFQWLKGLLGRTTVSDGPYKNRRFMRSEALKGSYWAICRPTNGAFTLFLALHTCDVVDAYGFITEDHSKYPNYYAERHSKTRVIFYANHDYNLEIKTWKKLHDTEIIRLYQRQESPERKTGKPTEP